MRFLTNSALPRPDAALGSTANSSVHRRPLVIGYGNPLRQDDGVGWHVALALAEDPRANGLHVLTVHQLTPDLAHDLHTASLAVLIDAAVGETAGHIRVTRLASAVARDWPTASGDSTALSHHSTPQSIATLAREVYGFAPPLALVGVGGLSFGIGDRLTPDVERAIPAIIECVLELVSSAVIDNPAVDPSLR